MFRLSVFFKKKQSPACILNLGLASIAGRAVRPAMYIKKYIFF